MKVSARVRISGPLASFAEGFGAELTAQGYTDLSLANQLRLMADLSRWLEAKGVEPKPHVLRHTTAVTLLQAGNDRAIIALWLGHESIETTQMYLDADLSTKERALARTAPLRTGARRYRPPDALLAFLQGL